MKLLSDESAQNPLEVSFYLILVILVMAFLMFTMGTFIDNFLYIALNIDIDLSTWGQGMMANVVSWANWIYYIPSIFIIIVMVWGVKAVIKRHQYTTQDQQYMDSEDF